MNWLSVYDTLSTPASTEGPNMRLTIDIVIYQGIHGKHNRKSMIRLSVGAPSGVAS